MASRSPPSALLAAEKDASTSGAPLPKAKKVTPAKLSLIDNDFEIYSKAGER